MNNRLPFFLALLFLPLIACTQDEEEGNNRPVVEDQHQIFGGSERMGILESDEITEASGISASRKYEHAIWVHNDSGNDPLIFLINHEANLLKTFLLEGIENRDWEDISIGPGADPDLSYIYLGDIGDNLRLRETKTIYRFPEPEFSHSDAAEIDTIRQIETFSFYYPDGRKDAEALMVDPLSQDIYIIAKDADNPTIYRLPSEELQNKQPLSLLQEGNVKIGNQGLFGLVTAGDVSADGMEVLIKSYNQVYYWQRQDLNTSIGELLKSTPDTLEYVPEPQGEAITFSREPDGYFTLSEKRFNQTPVLYFYRRK